MNPFSAFAFQGDAKEESARIGAVHECDNKKRKAVSQLPSVHVDMFRQSPPAKSGIGVKKHRVSKPSDPKIMMDWWVELKGLTSSYPFAVMVTGVLGSQCRDIVTISVMRNLAELVNDDITPQSVSSLSLTVIENALKSLNYCNKKAKLLQELASIFCHEPVPSTSAGLLKVHGIGPAISEVILCVAFDQRHRQCRESTLLDQKRRRMEDDENKITVSVECANGIIDLTEM